MLKLEQSRKRDVSITVRQKDPFFNKIFCAALLWAVGIHLFGFLAFHIAPFRINYSDSIFRPVSVASDIGKNAEGLALALIEEHIPVPPYLLLPSTIEHKSPSIPKIEALKPVEYYIPAYMSVTPFIEKETACLVYDCVAVGAPQGTEAKMVISGPLRDFIRDIPTLQMPQALAGRIKQAQSLSFSVIADGPSGKIVWFKPEGRYSPTLMTWSEGIIKGMDVQKNSEDLSISGNIEIILSALRSE